MNNIILILITFTFGASTFTVHASGEDHSGHDHSKESHKSHSDDDGHNHKKKKKEDHTGHDHDSIEHNDHKDDDNHSGHDHAKGKHDDDGDHDGHDHGGGKAIGKGKAIEVVDEVKGFKLSREAIKTLKLKLQTVDGDEFQIVKSTLVASKGIKGLYRFRGGFFKFMPVKLLKEIGGKYLVKVKGVDFGDQIVTNGVGLLRVTDVYSTDKSEYGHSH
jgi:hypothetical protein